MLLPYRTGETQRVMKRRYAHGSAYPLDSCPPVSLELTSYNLQLAEANQPDIGRNRQWMFQKRSSISNRLL